jgi:FkbM family methyltransferase
MSASTGRWLRQQLGLWRSILVYYGNPRKLRRMARFYAALIQPGDLCFDLGAHVGNRLHVWAGLGARVIGVEPQPLCLDLLRRWYGQHPQITLVGAAVGATPGEQMLWISSATPTVTSLAPAWIATVQQAPSFAGVRWDAQTTVPVLTLDHLIEQYGQPVFCKIDVEGYELEVLRGLSQPLPALSFEYIPAAPDLALACVDRLAELGRYEFNYVQGEQHRWHFPAWRTAHQLRPFLETQPRTAPSGDLYARRVIAI